MESGREKRKGGRYECWGGHFGLMRQGERWVGVSREGEKDEQSLEIFGGSLLVRVGVDLCLNAGLTFPRVVMRATRSAEIERM